jgi:hypothetical protein
MLGYARTVPMSYGQADGRKTNGRKSKMKRKVYQELATAIDARLRCVESGNTEWYTRWTDRIESIAQVYLPHGSGFDSGTTVNLDKSTRNRIVLDTSYHHMDESGYYSGWTDHQVIVTPDFVTGFDIRITGRNRNDWKDYAYQVFESVLSEEITDD